MAKLPFVSNEALQSIVAKFPTPFYLYDEQGIRDNARRLKRAFHWNEGFKEYFAVKATPTPAILDILKEEGCGVDCASLTELLLVEALGFYGEEIMFSSNVTPVEDFRLARSLSALVNFDDISHIDFFYKNVGPIPSVVSCRYNPGDLALEHNAIMSSPKEAKYGFTRDQLTKGFKKLQAKGVEQFGLHAFLASNTRETNYYPSLARMLFETAVELHKETGASIAFINLSGGIGIPYAPDEAEADIESISKGVQEAFQEVLVANNLPHVRIFTELGRYMLAPYGCLVSRVLHEKKTHKHYIGLDACAADFMRPAMYGAYHHITVMGKDTTPSVKYDVTGGLCENNDKFAVNRFLPKIDIGDLLVIHDTGAHGHAMGYNYNGKLRCAELLLRQDGSVELIRRAETPADYFATIPLPGKLDSSLRRLHA